MSANAFTSEILLLNYKHNFFVRYPNLFATRVTTLLYAVYGILIHVSSLRYIYTGLETSGTGELEAAVCQRTVVTIWRYTSEGVPMKVVVEIGTITWRA